MARCTTGEDALTQGCLLSSFLISSVYKFAVVQTILELMDCGTYRDSAHIHALLSSAREQLRSIRSRPCPVPAPGSNAFLAFDPFVARKLNSFGPLRTHELPPQERVWDALQCFLDDWDELRLLCGTTSILTWEVGDLYLIGIVLTRIYFQVFGYLRAWSTRPRQMFPYMRSLTQVNTLFNSRSQHILKLSPVGVLQRCSSFEQIYPDMDRRALFLRNSQSVIRYLCSGRQREVARFCPTTFFRA